MNNIIKRVFYLRYLDSIFIPFIILTVFVVIAFILSYIFVKIELNKDMKRKEVKNDKKI